MCTEVRIKLDSCYSIRDSSIRIVQFSEIAKKLNIDLGQVFSHRKEALSLLKS